MKLCYLCGTKLIKNHNKSKDHVPPDCIFPNEKPPNLITVPCCIDCNKKYETLDEEMRNIISIIAGEKALDVGEKAKKEILKSPKKLDQFLLHTKPHPSLVDDAGNPRLLYYFKDKELNKWLIRVVKGLYFHRNNTIINEHSTFKVNKYPDMTPQPSKTFPMEEGLNLRPYFVYSVMKDENFSNTDFWLLIFYDHVMFSVTVGMPIDLQSQ